LIIAVLTAAILPSSGGAGATNPGSNGKIAFTCVNADGTTDICVIEADGSGQTTLTNDPANEITAAWSPDGSKIAFASNRDGDLEVFVMNADGSDPVQITDNDALDCCARWSPDGTQLAFHSDRTGDIDVFVMGADGSAQTNLTENPPAFDGDVDWSPDGTKVIFASDRSGEPQLFTINPDGSGLEQITTGLGYNPSWSPDGQQIAFARYVGDRPDGDPAYDVLVSNIDGSNEINLTNIDLTADQSYGNPSWSPDGTMVLFDGGGGSPYVGGLQSAARDEPSIAPVSAMLPGEEAPFDGDWQPLQEEGATPESEASPSAEVDDDDGDGDNNTTVWIVVGVVAGAALIAGAATFAVIRMRG
jgi:TolB protein